MVLVLSGVTVAADQAIKFLLHYLITFTRQRFQSFAVKDDDDTHPALKNTLRKQGYRVLHAIGLEDAIDWMGDGFVHADMVLVDIKGRTADDNLTVGRHIRKHAKYNNHTPLVVMPEKYGQDVEGTELNVEGNDWVFIWGKHPTNY